MPSQWVFRITLLSLAIKFSHQQDTADCSFSDNCDTSQNIGQIVCAKSFGGVSGLDCQCQGSSCSDQELSGITASVMDAVKCSDLCQGVP